MTLPKAVRDLALRLGADPTRVVGQVQLTQSGEMKLSLDAQTWLPFSAQQTMSVTNCAFSWRARFWPLGYLSVIDALHTGKGRLDVTALGFIPLVRTKPSAALTKAEMLRYLAELPFAPDAILHNPALSWHAVDANQLAVSCGTGAMRSEVVFALDANGRVASASASDRPRSATAPHLPTPWRGAFSDYRHQHGRWIPFSGQVAWVIDGVENLYWRGSLTRWAMSAPAPFAGPVWAGVPASPPM